MFTEDPDVLAVVEQYAGRQVSLARQRGPDVPGPRERRIIERIVTEHADMHRTADGGMMVFSG
jgi:hypothetical protein